MTAGLDLAAAIIGIMAFFGHLLNKFKKLITMSRACLKMLVDSSRFQEHLRFLADTHRARLISHHGPQSQQAQMLDRCIAACEGAFEQLHSRLRRIENSRWKLGRAFIEQGSVDRLNMAMQNSNTQLATIMTMTTSVSRSFSKQWMIADFSLQVPGMTSESNS
jgi:hypothetical protein